ncbi:hypothetical protein D3C77_304510 [compost metagenome]
MVELVNGVLQLTIQHHTISDNHHAIEKALVSLIMQTGQAMCQPGYGVALAAACRMLDQIVMSNAFVRRSDYHLTYRLQLVIARKYKAFLAHLLAVI